MKLPRDISAAELVSSLQKGTLSSILNDIVAHFKLPKDEVMKKLFG
jgi:hypothetical protein